MRHALVSALLVLGIFVAREASARSKCVEVSDIVGERNCSRYGELWSIEGSCPIVVSMGAVHTTTNPAGRTFSAKTGGRGTVVYTFDGERFGTNRLSASGFDLRARGNLTPWLYIGADWAFTYGRMSHAPFEADGRHVEVANGLSFRNSTFGGVIGSRLPLGHLTIRAEVLLGFDVLSVTQHAVGNYDAWQPHTNGRPWQTMTAESRGALVQPRVAVDLWASPWITLSAWSGMNVLRRSDRAMGLTFAFHVRPYDGAYSVL